MTQTEQHILDLITKATSILVVSHIRPDWDALSSSLLAASLLQKQYPTKKITIAIEKGVVSYAQFLPGYTTIDIRPMEEVIRTISPDLILMTDCPEFQRISYDSSWRESFYRTTTIPIIAIDHHELAKSFAPSAISNHHFSSAVEEVHHLMVTTYGFSETPETNLYLATGIWTDTGGFMFLKNKAEITLAYAQRLISAGISFEEIDRLVNRYDQDHLNLLAEYFKNLTITPLVTYSYISNEFYALHPAIKQEKYTETKEIFTQKFIRQVSDNNLFFVVYPEPNGTKGSLRAINDTFDTTVFAQYLNGGGHKPACGFFLAENHSIQNAIEQVLSTIEREKENARIIE